MPSICETMNYHKIGQRVYEKDLGQEDLSKIYYRCTNFYKIFKNINSNIYGSQRPQYSHFASQETPNIPKNSKHYILSLSLSCCYYDYDQFANGFWQDFQSFSHKCNTLMDVNLLNNFFFALKQFSCTEQLFLN